jgi:DNA-binding IclR family transcriptional regulator
LIDRIRETRSKGWAWNIEEYVVGITGCAVPVLSRGGKLVAGLGVSAPSARMDYNGLQKLIPRLKIAANKIAAAIS